MNKRKLITSNFKLNTSVFLAILFHLSGLIGILYTSYNNWFIANTPINLSLMALLLIWNQSNINKGFTLFFLICFSTGMITEMIGVNTGYLFGQYHYGNILGIKWMGVPLLIGVNWFVTVYSCLIIMEQLHRWIKTKFIKEDQPLPSAKFETLSVIVDGALLASYFDWLMEPVAVKLGYWQWASETIPVYNYLCWFVISVALIAIARKLSFIKQNPFAIHLILIQALFFLTLRTFL